MSDLERKIIDKYLFNLPHDERMFRTNAGMGWQGESVRHGDKLIIKNPRPFHGMVEGFPDLCGFKSVIIAEPCCGSCSHYIEIYDYDLNYNIFKCKFGNGIVPDDFCESYQPWKAKKIAIFQAVEVKTGKLKLSEMQKKFRDLIIKMGGIFKEIR